MILSIKQVLIGVSVKDKEQCTKKVIDSWEDTC